MNKEHNTRNHACKRDLMRVQLAHQAAKLMAEDGITDHAFAKRKAARQLGAADTRHLPSNQEVDDALHSYLALYQHDSHPVSCANCAQKRSPPCACWRSFTPT